MNKELKENEVYFIGHPKKAFYRNKIFYMIIIIIAFLASATLIYMLHNENVNSKEQVIEGKELNAIKILPKESTPPLFKEKYDMGEFLKWIGKNLQYPDGYETIDAKVIVSFVIQTDGTLGQIKILSAPKNKIFEKKVLEMLKRCPKWKPAKLTNGKAVCVEYTLPVLFKKIGTK